MRIKQVSICKVLRRVCLIKHTKYKQYVELLRTYHVPGAELGVWLQKWKYSHMVCLLVKLTAWQEDMFIK